MQINDNAHIFINKTQSPKSEAKDASHQVIKIDGKTVALPAGSISIIGKGQLEEETFRTALNEALKKAIDSTAYTFKVKIHMIYIDPNIENIPAFAFSQLVNFDYNVQTSFKVEMLPGESKLKAIGKNAFARTYIEEIELPDSVETVGEGAFSNCAYLKRVKLSAQMTKIASDTFMLS